MSGDVGGGTGLVDAVLTWDLYRSRQFGERYFYEEDWGGGGGAGAEPEAEKKAEEPQQPPSLCAQHSVDLVMFGSGAWATVSGLAFATGGTVSALIGVGAIGVPGANVSSPLLVGGGTVAIAYGTMNVRDGISMMASAMDNQFRDSTLGDVFGGLFGSRGRDTGNALAEFIAIGSLTRTAANAATHGAAIRDAVDATATVSGFKEPRNMACP